MVFSFLGSLCLLIYGMKTYFSGMEFYAYCLLSLSVATAINYLVYRLYGNWQWYLNFITYAFFALYIFLLATGGEENTGILWCFAYPLILFPLLGLKRGTKIMLLILVCSIVILYFPDLVWATHSYSDNMIYRFTGSMGFVSIMAFLMERSRMLTQQQMDKAQQELRMIARSDELTNMWNRRGIKEKAQLELHRVARDKTELTLVLCDADLFKKINDRYGHDVGDAALRQISRILKETIRITDSAGRWGGEEFLILLPNTSLTDGYQLIERIREKIASEPLVMEDLRLNLSISCGICSTRFVSRFEDLIKAADISLYEAKAQGRNCTRPILSGTQ